MNLQFAIYLQGIYVCRHFVVVVVVGNDGFLCASSRIKYWCVEWVNI